MPGKFYGQRSLVGYNPRGCKQSDTSKQLISTVQLRISGRLKGNESFQASSVYFSETPEGTHQSCCCSVTTHQSTMLWKPSRGPPLVKIRLTDTLSSSSQLPYRLTVTNSHFSCLSYCPASSVVLIPSTANCFPFFFCCTMQLVGFLTAPHSLWDPSSLTRGRTQAPCTDGEVLTTGLPGKSLVGF